MNDKFDPKEVMEVLGDEPKAVKQYPKFQISKFLDSKRDYQVVVRKNLWNNTLQRNNGMSWVTKNKRS